MKQVNIVQEIKYTVELDEKDVELIRLALADVEFPDARVSAIHLNALKEFFRRLVV